VWRFQPRKILNRFRRQNDVITHSG
jgi:hypothetical protein